MYRKPRSTSVLLYLLRIQPEICYDYNCRENKSEQKRRELLTSDNYVRGHNEYVARTFDRRGANKGNLLMDVVNQYICDIKVLMRTSSPVNFDPIN